MYEDILPENYGQSYANPSYAAARLGDERGKLMCFLYAQLRGIIAYLFEGKEEAVAAHLELFLQIFRLVDFALADLRCIFANIADPVFIRLHYLAP
jgi:hypothetical protein